MCPKSIKGHHYLSQISTSRLPLQHNPSLGNARLVKREQERVRSPRYGGENCYIFENQGPRVMDLNSNAKPQQNFEELLVELKPQPVIRVRLRQRLTQTFHVKEHFDGNRSSFCIMLTESKLEL